MKPSNSKFIKSQKGRLKSFVSVQSTKVFSGPVFGDFSLFSCENGFLIDKHVEIGKKVLKSFLGKKGLLWVIVFPNKSITKKPVGVRMGKGKGGVSNWVTPVYAGSSVFEIKNVSHAIASKAFQLIQKKLPLQTQWCARVKPIKSLYLLLL
jgi:large subunit ribosomal protein L16